MSDSAAAGGRTDRGTVEVSLFDLLGVIWRKKWLIIIVTLLSAIGVLAYTIGSILLPPDRSYLPNLYTPRAVVLISQSGDNALSSSLASSGAAGLAALAGIDLSGKSYGELAILLARSRTSLDELNHRFNFTMHYKISQSVNSDTRRAILDNLDLSFDAKTSTLSISFTDKDPAFAQLVVNALVEVLDARFALLGGSRARKQMELLASKIADVNVEITALQQRLQDFTDTHGVIDIEALATEQITVMARLRSEMILKDMEIENYVKFATIDDPVIRRLRSERDSIRSKITELETGTGAGVLPNQRQLPALAFEYSALNRDLAVQTQIYKLLTQQYEISKMNAEGQEPAFQVLELAEVPDKKSGPSRAIICVVVTLSAFAFSILLSLVMHAVQRLWKDPDVRRRLRQSKPQD